MFDHVSIGVSDLKRVLPFYDAVMGALGHGRYFGDEAEGLMAYGSDRGFFVVNLPLDESKAAQACNGSHICFKTGTKEDVDSFYRVAMAHGARDDGPPGLRPAYGENYYACFVRDPDGHKIEAVAYL